LKNNIFFLLDDFLTDFPPVIKQKIEPKVKAEQIDWDKCYESLQCDRNVKVVDWYIPSCYLLKLETKILII
jgi:hypothetical protein